MRVYQCDCCKKIMGNKYDINYPNSKGQHYCKYCWTHCWKNGEKINHQGVKK